MKAERLISFSWLGGLREEKGEAAGGGGGVRAVGERYSSIQKKPREKKGGGAVK